MLALPAWGSSPRRAAQGRDWHEDKNTGIAYWCDNSKGEAEVADWYDESEGVYEYYSQAELTVPADFILYYGGASLDGNGGGGSKTYKVTALGEYAFRNAAASKLSFEEPSNVETIRSYALYMMPNLKGRLVLPSSLSKLELSAVVLTCIDTLEFLGDVPPVCVTAESGDAVNPWTSAAGETDRNTVIIVPDGRLAAYMAQKGIGDWFTSVREKSGSTTGMAETEQGGRVPRSGVWSLTGRYIGAPSVAGTLPSGVYIINGRKTAL